MDGRAVGNILWAVMCSKNIVMADGDVVRLMSVTAELTFSNMLPISDVVWNCRIPRWAPTIAAQKNSDYDQGYGHNNHADDKNNCCCTHMH